MKITVWVLSTCIPDENRPCFPNVFPSEETAEAYAEERLKEEWASLDPYDDDGEPLPYPGDWRQANEQISAETPEWGQWEMTTHEIEIGSIVVHVSGGVVQDIEATGALTQEAVTVLDHDNDDPTPGQGRLKRREMMTHRYFKVSPRGFANEVYYFRVPMDKVDQVDRLFAGYENRPEGGYCGWTDDSRARMPGVAVEWADRKHILSAEFWGE